MLGIGANLGKGNCADDQATKRKLVGAGSSMKPLLNRKFGGDIFEKAAEAGDSKR